MNITKILSEQFCFLNIKEAYIRFDFGQPYMQTASQSSTAVAAKSNNLKYNTLGHKILYKNQFNLSF